MMVEIVVVVIEAFDIWCEQVNIWMLMIMVVVMDTGTCKHISNNDAGGGDHKYLV